MLIEMSHGPSLEQVRYFLERNGVVGARVAAKGPGAVIEIRDDAGLAESLLESLRRHCAFADLFQWVPNGLHDVAFWDKPHRWGDVVLACRRLFPPAAYDAYASVEARGFALGAVLAYASSKPLVPVRKYSESLGQFGGRRAPYVTWRGHHDALWLPNLAWLAGRRVLFFDDVLETGNSLDAAASLLASAGAAVVGAFYLCDVSMPGVRDRFAFPVRSLLRMYDLGANTPIAQHTS